MTVLSLFDGISCARVALDRLGYSDITYYASEVDKYAIAVSQRNWPDIIQLGDVRGIRAEMFAEPIDLLIGGSPCQDLSIAKAGRKGLDGERSGLFWEYVRIWKEINPKYFVLENVNSMPKEAKRIITEVMGVEPIMINAALVSAQNRKRLFWTNICADVFGNQTMPLPDDRGILLRDILESGEELKLNNRPRGKSYCLDANYWKSENLKHNASHHLRQLVVEPKSYAVPSSYYKENVKSLEQRKKKGLMVAEPVAIDHYNGNRVVPNNKAKVLGTNPQCETAVAGQSVSDGYTIRKLTPVECERLQSLPDGYTEGISNTQRYKCLGNAFNVEVVRHILSFMGAE